MIGKKIKMRAEINEYKQIKQYTDSMKQRAGSLRKSARYTLIQTNQKAEREYPN